VGRCCCKRCWNGPADRKIFRFGLKAGLSAALIAVLWTQVDFGPALASMAAMDGMLVAGVFALLLAHGVVSAWRWWAIMRLQGDAPDLRLVLRLFFVGMFFNQTLSTTLGGDAARVVLLRARGTGMVVSSIMLERAAGLLALIALIPAALLLAPNAVPVMALAVLAAVLAVLIAFGPRLRDARWRWVAAAGRHLGDARAILLTLAGLPVLALSLAIHMGGGLAVYGLALASGAALDLLVCVTLVPPVLLLATLPVSFGGWGVREAALIGLLGPFGIAADQALGLSIALGLLVMAAGLPGGVLWLMPKKNKSEF
jgi:uncharacterized membrane protein YbhN (UPF0104 family)